MYPQNYKSDFKFVVRRYKCVDGKEELTPVPFPDDLDWRLRLTTPHSFRYYEASYTDGVMHNCMRTDDGGIVVLMDDHKLACGELRYEFRFDLPDPVLPSRVAELYRSGSTGIMLVNDNSCNCGSGCGELIDVAVMLPMYKGDPFVYEDFTPEQLADLRRPATEAAEDAAAAVKALQDSVGRSESERTKAEAARETAEQQRAANETERQTAETGRADAEAERVKTEQSRQTAETARQTAEGQRKTAEAQRQAAETSRGNAEAARIDNETGRNAAEQQRVANETARQTAEHGREDAETARAAEEVKRSSAELSRQSKESERQTAETGRETKELQRNEAESRRAEAELLRVTAEESRAAAEIERAAAESQRISDESTRKADESTRQTAESERAANEAERIDNEAARQLSESGRALREQSRNEAETRREANENKRQTAETHRETSFSTAHEQALTAISSANDAAASATAAAKSASDAADKCADLPSNEQFGQIGYYALNGGAYTPSASYRTSGLLPLNRNHDLVYCAAAGGAASSLAFFSANGTVLSATAIKANPAITLAKEEFPNDAVYFAVSTVRSTVDISFYRNGDTIESREGAVSDAIQASKIALFVDEWNAANFLYYDGIYKFLDYDNVTNTFIVKCLYEPEYDTSLTYEEALRCYAGITTQSNFTQFPYTSGFKVILPPLNFHYGSGPHYESISRLTRYSNVQVIHLCVGPKASPSVDVKLDNKDVTITACTKLKAIIGCIGLKTLRCPDCYALEFFTIKTSGNVNIENSPKVRLDSLQYLVTNATNTSAITVTVHPEVYAKLTGDTTNAAAAALTPEELAQWQAVTTAAADKDISFATT